MRWFVEVSRVGESGLSEKYCVEAKQWQAALQEARKLRGDSGALSKFSIELLDDGYRAVDPSLKLRYLVNKAPGDSPLTPQSEDSEISTVTSNGKSGKHRAAAVVAPTAFASVAPESLAKQSLSGIPRPASHGAPRPGTSAPPRPASNAPPRMLVVPDDPVPPAPRAPTDLSVEPEREPAVVPLLPAFEVVRERGEEPRAESPITYREVAYAVKPGTSREQIEALLWARYKDVASAIEARPAGKFVQLAVFDHAFHKRPERPPLATFAWKDWRGSPVLAFPGFGEAPAGPISQVPPSEARVSMPPAAAPAAPASSQVSAPAEAVAASVVSFPPLAIAATAAAVPTAVPPPVAVAGSLAATGLLAAPAVASLVVVESAPVAQLAPAPIAPAPAEAASSEIAPMAAAAMAAPPVPATPEPAPAPVKSAPVLEINFDSTPFNAAPRKSSPDSERQSRPRMAVAGRRRAGEDLISELFELMHELHFMRDVAAGAEFVLSVLDEVLPCEGVLIHVFDINTNHFVVVRAKGPNAKSALLQRMPDQDPLALSVMRSPQAISIQETAGDPRFAGKRWETVGVTPKMALCGPVRQGGRYLGLIELVNPAGGAPFHSSELNALDYVCEQFAEFLSKKPIILAADVVLART
jgi:GAF domain